MNDFVSSNRKYISFSDKVLSRKILRKNVTRNDQIREHRIEA